MSLENKLNNLNLYDAKKYFRKAQNIVFSYTEMEAKVREATNNEPWGTPSTLMEYISQGTYNYKEREEVIGMIFRRFTEKTATEWRQIYKALQLLEYIIKHGSERFIDDCRANISLIGMLKDFHYIDSQGQDQGLNVRNRSKAIVDLLKDDGRIREERKHARETTEKYQGLGNSSVRAPAGVLGKVGGFNASSNRGVSVSADFDAEEEGGYTSRNYSSYDSTSYGEYKEHEYKPEEHVKSKTETKINSTVPDLLGDTEETPAAHKTETRVEEDDDDEFSDFHAAPATSTNNTAATATSGLNDLNSLYGANNNYNNTKGLFAKPASNSNNNAFALTPTSTSSKPQPGAFAQVNKSSKNDDIFGSLLNAAKAAKPIPAIPTKPAKVNNANNDDDDFGDLMGSAVPKTTTTTPAPQSNNSTNGGEIDLLSF